MAAHGKRPGLGNPGASDADHSEQNGPSPNTEPHVRQQLLIVEPVGRRGKFAARLDGRLLVRSSRTPFCDAARALLAEGVDSSTILVMRHAGSEVDALRARLGVAARLTVREDRGAPEFVRYRAFALDDVRPGTAVNGSAGTLPAEAAE
jgi:hypothetical protein